MRIAYAGAEGAFAHQACLAFAGGMEPIGVESFAAVVAAVERGEAACGMLPLHNSRAGEVADAVALVESGTVRVIARTALPVRMHLLGLPGACVEGLRVVRSHPMALKQCARALGSLGLPTEEAPNTALAARGIEDCAVGVLASEAAAEAYGLTILRRDMQDDPDNATIFAIVERNIEGKR
ncbi:MAG TPA: prephenate dehydratase domain-containing protein [Allosphingosinicella sp.]|nr:prephenate dehydratase domain-containing protein [Allosphingosinicella sp.]